MPIFLLRDSSSELYPEVSNTKYDNNVIRNVGSTYFFYKCNKTALSFFNASYDGGSTSVKRIMFIDGTNPIDQPVLISRT